MVVGGIVPVESRGELAALGVNGIFGPGSTLAEIIGYIRDNVTKERAL
jgi:methylmalonyl-CoA mutase C-terminal domain/subunit